MKLIELRQHTPEWHAFRAQHFGASEAAAMLGECPHKTREQLLHEKKTGHVPVPDTFAQQRFNRGHYFEELARNWLEMQLGEDLFPCVGVLENSRISASFDGVTMDQSCIFEHKTLNKVLRQAASENKSAQELPLHYRLQMEQQLWVSGAEKVLFMASHWDETDTLVEQYQWVYRSDPTLRQRLQRSWAQFEEELSNYAISTTLPAILTHTDKPPSLPLLTFQCAGQLQLSSNITDFKQQAWDVLESINRDLISDDDFAQAELTITWCKQGETQLTQALSQLMKKVPDIAALTDAIESIKARMRTLRLDLDKQVRAEKERRKQALIDNAVADVVAHYQAAGQTYGAKDTLIARLETAIKGLKTSDTLRNAIDRVVVAEKTALPQLPITESATPITTRLIKLGEINRALAPLSITADGLSQLGFHWVATDKSAKLYREQDFPLIIKRIITHLQAAQLPCALLKAA